MNAAKNLKHALTKRCTRVIDKGWKRKIGLKAYTASLAPHAPRSHIPNAHLFPAADMASAEAIAVVDLAMRSV